MKKHTLILALIYCSIVIAFKMIIWKGGLTFEDFWFKWTHLFSVVAVVPFMIIAIKHTRDKENGGYIRGREAAKLALGIFAISAIILSVYNYIEFTSSLDSYIAYYKGPKYMTILEADPKAKQYGYEKIIEFQVSQLRPFKAVTLKLVPFFVISMASAFICAAFMKKAPA